MAEAKKDDKVKVHYRGTLEDGSEFDSSEGMDPLEFALGQGMVIPGFENAIMGMSEGEKKTVTIPPEDAYGSYQDELIGEIPRAQISDDVQLEAGMQLQASLPDGTMTVVTVAAFDDETVTLDANHELAGKTLIFEIELVEIGAA
jgi:peptidylprolyl isomerase